MKKLIVLFIVLCVKLQAFTLGTEWVKEVEAGYNEGRYDGFLRSVEERVDLGMKNKEWDYLYELNFDELLESERALHSKYIPVFLDLKEGLTAIARRYPEEFVSKVIEDLQWLPDGLGFYDAALDLSKDEVIALQIKYLASHSSSNEEERAALTIHTLKGEHHLASCANKHNIKYLESLSRINRQLTFAEEQAVAVVKKFRDERQQVVWAYLRNSL